MIRSVRSVLSTLLVLVTLSCLSGVAGASAATPIETPPPADRVFMLVAGREADGAVRLEWAIGAGAHLYRDELRVRLDGRDLPLDTPAGFTDDDPNIGKVEIYRDRVAFDVRDLPRSGVLEVRARGCSDTGICYPPVTRRVDLATLAVSGDEGEGAPRAKDVVTMSTVATTPTTGALAAAESDAPPMDAMRAGGLGLFASFFGFGLLLSLTPCVFPMIPILSGILAGSRGDLSAWRGFLVSAAYVLAMASAYGAVGLIAGWTGANLQTMLQTPWVLGSAAVVFAGLALSMFGAFDLTVPAVWTSRFTTVGGKRGTLVGAALLGFGSALIVGPCVTPPMAAALLYAVDTGDATRGGGALFALGLGMGLPLLIAGTFGARVLPRSGAWLDRIKPVFGVVFLAVAILLVGRIVAPSVGLLLWGLLALGSGVFLGAFDGTTPEGGAMARLARTAGIALALWGAASIWGAAAGAGDPLRPLVSAGVSGPLVPASPTVVRVASVAGFDAAVARMRGRPILLRFTADWCTVCRSNEAIMADPALRSPLSSLAMIDVDVTETDPATRDLMRRFAVVGPPTLLLLDAEGHELPGSRLIGTVSVDALIHRLSAAGIQA